jgi:threonine dehydrogenase-like Zn-dependent dehydrogenase
MVFLAGVNSAPGLNESAAVPEPGTVWLFGIGVLGLAAAWRRRMAPAAR